MILLPLESILLVKRHTVSAVSLLIVYAIHTLLRVSFPCILVGTLLQRSLTNFKWGGLEK